MNKLTTLVRVQQANVRNIQKFVQFGEAFLIYWNNTNPQISIFSQVLELF